MKKFGLVVVVAMACVLATGAQAPLDQKEAFNVFLQQPAIQNHQKGW